jgi:chaperonin GroEL (HSP60 family)
VKKTDKADLARMSAAGTLCHQQVVLQLLCCLSVAVVACCASWAEPGAIAAAGGAAAVGERKTSYLEDIAILTGGTMVKDELGVTLDKADESVLGVAAKVLISKESCTIVGDGRTQVGDGRTEV